MHKCLKTFWERSHLFSLKASWYFWTKMSGSEERERATGTWTKVMETVMVNLGSGEGLIIHTSFQLSSHAQIKEPLPSYTLKYNNHEYAMGIFLCLWVYFSKMFRHELFLTISLTFYYICWLWSTKTDVSDF